jgi:hypothetical protein
MYILVQIILLARSYGNEPKIKMMVNNKLDKSFGPVGALSGLILFVVGIVMTCFYFSGLVLVLLGAFIGFTSTSTLLDFENKRVKFTNNLFGILRIGKWVGVEANMKIGIKDSNITWQSYSRGNRALENNTRDFRIVLTDSGEKEIMEIKKAMSFEAAKSDCETLANQLGLSMV